MASSSRRTVRFVTKAAAVQWGEEQRQETERGFLENYCLPEALSGPRIAPMSVPRLADKWRLSQG
jgi:hypothetical protein